MRNPRNDLPSGSGGALTIVIKLGTSSIVSELDLQPQLALLSSIVETVCSLKRLGHRVVLVSSGAIGMGLKRMEMAKKPKALQEKQALAAIGQGRLIALWDNLFSLLGQPIAQVLLTRNDISDRSRYLNSTKTFSALLSYGVIPIVNENDTVSVSEIKFGDNDTLSAITSSMVQADYLFLLTDVDCLYTDNPRRSPDAAPVRVVSDIEALREQVSTATLGSSLGTGGMETKIIAAELATGAGVATVITHGRKPDNILSIVNCSLDSSSVEEREEYERCTPLHTVFLPREQPLPDRRWWVLHGLKPRGRVIIDEGAYRAIARSATPPPPSSSHPHSRTPSTSTSPAPTMTDLTNSMASLTSEDGDPSASAVRPRPANSRSAGNGGRLLPAGVVSVEGAFAAGQAVTVVVRRRKRRQSRPHTSEETPDQTDLEDHHDDDIDEKEWELLDFGRGLTNYNSQEIERIKGHKSSEIERILGYIDAEHCVESITSLRRLEF